MNHGKHWRNDLLTKEAVNLEDNFPHEGGWEDFANEDTIDKLYTPSFYSSEHDKPLEKGFWRILYSITYGYVYMECRKKYRFCSSFSLLFDGWLL